MTLRRLSWCPIALAALSAPSPLIAQLQDRPIPVWLLSAPIASDTAERGLATSYLPDEPHLAPSAGQPVAGGRWTRTTAGAGGRVDIAGAFPGQGLDGHVVYGVTWISSPGERSIDLAVESDDDVKVWLNGVAVHAMAANRSVALETDTVALRLGAGRNRIVYKVINRDGGFGLGARVLSSSVDRIDDLVLSVDDARSDPPAVAGPAVTFGPVAVAERAVLAADAAGRPALMVSLTTRVTRWGAATAPVDVTVGGVRARAPVAAAGTPTVVTVMVPWDDLAPLARAGIGRVEGTSGAARGARRIPALGETLLEQLSRPIPVAAWTRTSGGNRWTPLTHSPDLGATAIAFSVAVPGVLAGLPLELDAAEHGESEIRVSGRAVRPDSGASVPICAPCAAGARVQVTIATGGRQWWDPPSLRVARTGWREVREGARWARRFGSAATPMPDARVMDSLLAGAVDPSKAAYLSVLDGWLDRMAPAIARARADTIDLIGNSHLDVVWLWEFAEGVEVLRNTWRTATKLLAKYPEMRFAGSSAYYYALLERSDPALLRSIQRLVRDGRWDLVGGWWVEADANMPSGESLVRQALYGQRTLRRLFGRTARVAWTPDTFGYPWSLPQLLRGAGIDGFVTQKMRWNDRNPWPPERNGFFWEGIDGTRLFSYIPYGYDHDLDPPRLAAEWDSTVSGGAMRRMLVLYGVGDHGGGPTMEMLDRGRDLRRVPTFPTLRDTDPGIALDRMRAALGSGPVVRDELYLEYHRGVFTTQAAMKRGNRRLEALLGAAEAAAALAPLAYPRDELRAAWEILLFNQMHDLLPGTSLAQVHRTAEAAYRRGDSIATVVIARSVRALVGAAPVAGGGGGRYAVFNPDATARSGVVRVPSPAAGPVQARDADGAPLPTARRGDSVDVRVGEVPGYGVRLISLAPGAETLIPASPLPPGVLENRWLRVEIDPRTGTIARLRDRVTGRDVLRPLAGGNGMVMLEDRPGSWDAWNIAHLHGTRFPVNQGIRVGAAQRDGLGTAISVTRERDSVTIIQRYVLPDSARRLDVETTVEWRVAHRLLKAEFILPGAPDSVRAEIAYASIARPATARTARDSGRFELPMHRWIDAPVPGGGLAIVNDGKYGYDVKGDTVRLSLLRAPTSPDPGTDQGTHRFRYSLVPHDGDWRDDAVRAAALELNAPLIAVAIGDGATTRAATVIVAGRGVSVGAVKRAEDGDELVVRLVEGEGRSTTAELRFPEPVTIQRMNLLEDPEGERSAAATTHELTLRPWEIATISVRRSRP